MVELGNGIVAERNEHGILCLSEGDVHECFPCCDRWLMTLPVRDEHECITGYQIGQIYLSVEQYKQFQFV